MQKSATKAMMMAEMLAPGATAAAFSRGYRPAKQLKSPETATWLQARAEVKRARVGLRNLRNARADLQQINAAEARLNEAQKKFDTLN